MAAQFNVDNLGGSKAGRQPIPMGVLVPTTRTNVEAVGIADKAESGRLPELLVVGADPLADIRVLAADRRNIARPHNGALASRLPGA